MRNLTVVLAIVTLFASALLTIPAMAQQEQEMTPEQKAEMEAWQKASTPNEHHSRLAGFEGTWSFTSRWWSAPGTESMESSGTAKYEMVMGGRFLKETVKSVWQGEPFEGIGYTGYDNLKKAYVSLWMDNMSTGFMVSEGSFNEGSNTYTWTGEYTDVMTGKLKTTRMVDKVVSSGKHVAEFFETSPDGKEFKSMEITYTRK